LPLSDQYVNHELRGRCESHIEIPPKCAVALLHRPRQLHEIWPVRDCDIGGGLQLSLTKRQKKKKKKKKKKSSGDTCGDRGGQGVVTP